MTQTSSALSPALAHMARRSALAMVSRARLANPALNAALLRRLSARPGAAGAMLADPVFETAKSWVSADQTLAELSGNLLSADLVEALDKAGEHAMARDLHPYAHQLAAWRASLGEGQSALVTSGTGSGKTECFMIPVLDDLLLHIRPGGGVQAILLYPLNALIESQRERLAAWAGGLGGRVRFALYNGNTPETERKAVHKSTRIELCSRKKIRDCPPEILVTNITMLEYLLLREQDRAILNASQGALRWIVLDEAHGYVGSQAAEMALLLRRVHAAFGVSPQDVRLMATSATIGGEEDTEGKLRAFLAALAGQPEDHVQVIKGCPHEALLPAAGPDRPIEINDLKGKTPGALWDMFADHPRLQRLRRAMNNGAVSLSKVAETLFDDATMCRAAQAVLDAAARAKPQSGAHALLPWRAHLFHRAQGGIWACINPDCSHRDAELRAKDANWPYGAIWLKPKARCPCGAPIFELVACTECGTAYLAAQMIAGAQPRLEAPLADDEDDFALDVEPDDEEPITGQRGQVWLAPGAPKNGAADDAVWIGKKTARIFDNAPPKDEPAYRLRLIENPDLRQCCAGAARARLQGLHFGPAFLLAATLPQLLEDLAPPLGGPGLPAGGRRVLSFSDSRQGVARIAAKLQQESERTLTRAFLWHVVQETKSSGNPEKISKLEGRLAKYRRMPEEWADEIIEVEAELACLKGDDARPVPWAELENRFAAQQDLRDFAGEVWQGRLAGSEMADDPVQLARMFLYRELARRPRVQNNSETMGLLRLAFPKLEEKARLMRLPPPLAEAGRSQDDWKALALASIDFVFRNNYALQIASNQMARWIFPRHWSPNAVYAASTRREDVSDTGAKFWPNPRNPYMRRSRLLGLVYALFNGNAELDRDQDIAAEILDALWHLVITTVAPDHGQGAHRLDFKCAAVVRLNQGYLCPVTRRPFGYSVAGRSPYAPARRLEPIAYPRLPLANAGGLTPEERAEIARWCATDPAVAALRQRGLWSDLHDRIAPYPAFIRAQEHSAQIERPVLKSYEDQFREGKINLLNCSTTMEMGVDIPDVSLVVNSNVPPSLSNYRQRVGRAGRRGEPWTFGMTYCRDLPLDRLAFDKPAAFLARPITAPRVWFDSPALVARHVNAALLARWLGDQGGMKIRASIGAFLGAGETPDLATLPDAPADRFIDDLKGRWGEKAAKAPLLCNLVFETALAHRTPEALVIGAAEALEKFAQKWRVEYRALLELQEATADKDAAMAFRLRAKRMRGEFLLGEMARRGFTPAYGFPTDVVTFDTLAACKEGWNHDHGHSFDKRGGASRTLDIAIREYAPGAEVVVDGLVYLSEGIRPAWGANADLSHLEDFRDFWTCATCHAFGAAPVSPDQCPNCGAPVDVQKILKPTGFLSRKRPHTGYEHLAHIPFEVPHLSAHGAGWQSLPDPIAGRIRHDPKGHVIATSRGTLGGGYALCLDCGRAVAMQAPDGNIAAPVPEAMTKHKPLAMGRNIKLTHDGYCPGGYSAPHRVQRHVVLAADSLTDVFELQLPDGAKPEAVLALAAGLREALAQLLGVTPDEIRPTSRRSLGPAGEDCLSAYLYDRAANGAGLVARLAEPEVFAAAVKSAVVFLSCPEACAHGCPACILRPDLNLRDIRMDRPGGLALARGLSEKLLLPDNLKIFGADTRLVGYPALQSIERHWRAQDLTGLDIFLHGSPARWDFGGWRLAAKLPELAAQGIKTRLILPTAILAQADFDLAAKLALHRLAHHGAIAMTDTLPMAMGRPVIARLRRPNDALLIAADPAEAMPGSTWGEGAAGPLVWGNEGAGAVKIQAPRPISADKLITISTGSAHVLWPKHALDGSLKEFGKRFWALLAKKAPLEIAAMRQQGVARIHYSDRYLLTPLTLALFARLVAWVPGGKRYEVTVDLAREPYSRSGSRAIFHGFPTTSGPRDFLKALLPKADIRLAAKKSDLPHHRVLLVTLEDGRELRLLLDQGMGAWRSNGFRRHNFDASSSAQGKALQGADFGVTIENEYAGTITLDWVKSYKKATDGK